MSQLVWPTKFTCEDGATYEPWTDGTVVGFRVTYSGITEYVYLNPSSGSNDGAPTVFLYRGTVGDPAEDEPVVFVDFGK